MVLKPKPLQRRKSKTGMVDGPENTSHALAATAMIQDDEDFYREPIKRIVRPDNQVCLTLATKRRINRKLEITY
jgi:hypothetical protein